MEHYPSVVVGKVEIPETIDKEWLATFTDSFGRGRYEIELMATNWLVQGPRYNDRYSTSFELDDAVGPGGGLQSIKGTIWYAGMVETTKYIDKRHVPAVYLLNARLILRNGEESPIIDSRYDRLAPEAVLAPAEERVVLVRLDRVVGEQQVKVIPIESDLPPVA